jgi:beta-lactamase class A/beta-lactamase class A VEB
MLKAAQLSGFFCFYAVFKIDLKKNYTMNRLLYSTTILIWLATYQAAAQTIDSLKQKIREIVSTKNATVGVAIVGNNGKDTLTLNGDRRFPMQSVFKFHIALALLSEIDKGKFTLNQKIEIEPKYLFPTFWSPIKDKYPQGTALTIAEIIDYTVAQSDNVGCDALLRLLGSPKVVETYFKKHKFKNIAIKINEQVMQSNWDLQFQNWTTPKAANQVLAAFYENDKKLLSAPSHDFIWNIMKQTSTGKDRLKGQLPTGTTVAHKTGWSGTGKDGITAAVNDIGIVFLPNGQYFVISVFVTNSKEDIKTNEKIIADIAKAAYHYFMTETK